MNNNECCIADILEVINVLQCQAEKIDDIPNTCDRTLDQLHFIIVIIH